LDFREAVQLAEVEGDALGDAVVVEEHATLDERSAPAELHLKWAPEDAPPPNEDIEGALDHHAAR